MCVNFGNKVELAKANVEGHLESAMADLARRMQALRILKNQGKLETAIQILLAIKSSADYYYNLTERANNMLAAYKALEKGDAK